MSFSWAWIADIDMPARFRLVEVDADYVTGIARDDDDVESIVVYRLKKR